MQYLTSLKLNIRIIFKILGIVLIFIGAELFGEGLAKLIPSAAELFEEGGFILFGGISLLYFLQDDIKRLFKRN